MVDAAEVAFRRRTTEEELREEDKQKEARLMEGWSHLLREQTNRRVERAIQWHVDTSMILERSIDLDPTNPDATLDLLSGVQRVIADRLAEYDVTAAEALSEDGELTPDMVESVGARLSTARWHAHEHNNRLNFLSANYKFLRALEQVKLQREHWKRPNSLKQLERNFDEFQNTSLHQTAVDVNDAIDGIREAGKEYCANDIEKRKEVAMAVTEASNNWEAIKQEYDQTGADLQRVRTAWLTYLADYQMLAEKLDPNVEKPVLDKTIVPLYEKVTASGEFLMAEVGPEAAAEISSQCQALNDEWNRTLKRPARLTIELELVPKSPSPSSPISHSSGEEIAARIHSNTLPRASYDDKQSGVIVTQTTTTSTTYREMDQSPYNEQQVLVGSAKASTLPQPRKRQASPLTPRTIRRREEQLIESRRPLTVTSATAQESGSAAVSGARKTILKAAFLKTFNLGASKEKSKSTGELKYGEQMEAFKARSSSKDASRDSGIASPEKLMTAVSDAELTRPSRKKILVEETIEERTIITETKTKKITPRNSLSVENESEVLIALGTLRKSDDGMLDVSWQPRDMHKLSSVPPQRHNTMVADEAETVYRSTNLSSRSPIYEDRVLPIQEVFEERSTAYVPDALRERLPAYRTNGETSRLPFLEQSLERNKDLPIGAIHRRRGSDELVDLSPGLMRLLAGRESSYAVLPPPPRPVVRETSLQYAASSGLVELEERERRHTPRVVRRVQPGAKQTDYILWLEEQQHLPVGSLKRKHSLEDLRQFPPELKRLRDNRESSYTVLKSERYQQRQPTSIDPAGYYITLLHTQRDLPVGQLSRNYDGCQELPPSIRQAISGRQLSYTKLHRPIKAVSLEFWPHGGLVEFDRKREQPSQTSRSQLTMLRSTSVVTPTENGHLELLQSQQHLPIGTLKSWPSQDHLNELPDSMKVALAGRETSYSGKPADRYTTLEASSIRYKSDDTGLVELEPRERYTDYYIRWLDEHKDHPVDQLAFQSESTYTLPRDIKQRLDTRESYYTTLSDTSRRTLDSTEKAPDYFIRWLQTNQHMPIDALNKDREGLYEYSPEMKQLLSTREQYYSKLPKKVFETSIRQTRGGLIEMPPSSRNYTMQPAQTVNDYYLQQLATNNDLPVNALTRQEELLCELPDDVKYTLSTRQSDSIASSGGKGPTDYYIQWLYANQHLPVATLGKESDHFYELPVEFQEKLAQRERFYTILPRKVYETSIHQTEGGLIEYVPRATAARQQTSLTDPHLLLLERNKHLPIDPISKADDDFYDFPDELRTTLAQRERFYTKLPTSEVATKRDDYRLIEQQQAEALAAEIEKEKRIREKAGGYHMAAVIFGGVEALRERSVVPLQRQSDAEQFAELHPTVKQLITNREMSYTKLPPKDIRRAILDAGAVPQSIGMSVMQADHIRKLTTDRYLPVHYLGKHDDQLSELDFGLKQILRQRPQYYSILPDKTEQTEESKWQQAIGTSYLLEHLENQKDLPVGQLGKVAEDVDFSELPYHIKEQRAKRTVVYDVLPPPPTPQEQMNVEKTEWGNLITTAALLENLEDRQDLPIDQLGRHDLEEQFSKLPVEIKLKRDKREVCYLGDVPKPTSEYLMAQRLRQYENLPMQVMFPSVETDQLSPLSEQLSTVRRSRSAHYEGELLAEISQPQAAELVLTSRQPEVMICTPYTTESRLLEEEATQPESVVLVCPPPPDVMICPPAVMPLNVESYEIGTLALNKEDQDFQPMSDDILEVIRRQTAYYDGEVPKPTFESNLIRQLYQQSQLPVYPLSPDYETKCVYPLSPEVSSLLRERSSYYTGEVPKPSMDAIVARRLALAADLPVEALKKGDDLVELSPSIKRMRSQREAYYFTLPVVSAPDTYRDTQTLRSNQTSAFDVVSGGEQSRAQMSTTRPTVLISEEGATTRYLQGDSLMTQQKPLTRRRESSELGEMEPEVRQLLSTRQTQYTTLSPQREMQQFEQNRVLSPDISKPMFNADIGDMEDETHFHDSLTVTTTTTTTFTESAVILNDESYEQILDEQTMTIIEELKQRIAYFEANMAEATMKGKLVATYLWIIKAYQLMSNRHSVATLGDPTPFDQRRMFIDRLIAELPEQRLTTLYQLEQDSRLSESQKQQLRIEVEAHLTALERILFEERGRIKGRLELWRAVPTFSAEPLRRSLEAPDGVGQLPQGRAFDHGIGRWHWAVVDGVKLPTVDRGLVPYVSAYMVHVKLFCKFPPTLPAELAGFQMVSHKMTPMECWILNIVNAGFECKFDYGYRVFTPDDEIVRLQDIEHFYWAVKFANLQRMADTYQELMDVIAGRHPALTSILNRLRSKVKLEMREGTKKNTFFSPPTSPR